MEAIMETTDYATAESMEVDMNGVYQMETEEEDEAGFTPEEDFALQSYFSELQREMDPARDDMEDDEVDVPEIDKSLQAYFNELQVNKAANEPHELEDARLAALASARRRHLPPAPPAPAPPVPAPAPGP
jgi:hypothetical protein